MLQKIRPGVRLVCAVDRGPYWRRLLRTGPITLWPQWETEGSVAHCLVNPAQNGQYVGVSLADNLGPFGWKAPYYDGANDYCNVFSAAFRDALNGSEGTALIWARVANAGVWTDATSRYQFHCVDTNDFNEWVSPYKHTVFNRLMSVYIAGGVNVAVAIDSMTTTGWFCHVITWSASGDKVEAFIDGISKGSVGSLGTWAGTIDRATIGSANTVPASVWHGWLGPHAYWNRVLSPGTIMDLARA